MRYRVFTRDPEGGLNWAATSMSLGDGPRDIALIVDGHELAPGDLVYISDLWLLILSVESSTDPVDRPFDVEYRVLSPYGDQVGDLRWDSKLATQLYRKAVRMES